MKNLVKEHNFNFEKEKRYQKQTKKIKVGIVQSGRKNLSYLFKA